MFIYDLSIFLTSTAFVGTNAKYGIPLSRHAAFFENCPLGHDPIRIFILFSYSRIKYKKRFLEVLCRRKIFFFQKTA